MSKSHRGKRRQKKWWDKDSPPEQFRQIVTAVAQREYWRRQIADPPIRLGSSQAVVNLDAYRETMTDLQARLEHLYVPGHRRWDLPWLAERLPTFNVGSPALLPAMQDVAQLLDLTAIRYDWLDEYIVIA